MQNAVAAQQQMNVLSQAITTQAINRLMNANRYNRSNTIG
ncbi:RebB family R body protein [Chloroflexi bacterium TSY]|nr:RebB family R body protein [Chloroflexi bacterium TSY]